MDLSFFCAMHQYISEIIKACYMQDSTLVGNNRKLVNKTVIIGATIALVENTRPLFIYPASFASRFVCLQKGVSAEASGQLHH